MKYEHVLHTTFFDQNLYLKFSNIKQMKSSADEWAALWRGFYLAIKFRRFKLHNIA